MTSMSQISISAEVVARAAQYISAQLRQSGAESAALCTLDGQCVWASDAAFERAAPTVARIGIASLRLWAKTRTGKLEQIGLVTDEGPIDLIFVPPLGSLLVVSRGNEHGEWPAGEPKAMIQALGLT